MTELRDAIVGATLPLPRRGRPAARRRNPARPRPLLARVNAVAVLLAAVDGGAWLTAVLRTGPGPVCAAVTAVALAGVRVGGRVHRRRLWLSWLQDLPRSVTTAALAFALVTGAGLVSGMDSASTAAMQEVILLAAVLSEGVRPLVFAFGRWARRRLRRCDRAVVVGSGLLGGDLVRTMLEHPEFGLLPVGFAPSGDAAAPAGLPVERIDGDLTEAIARLGAGTVVLAPAGDRDAAIVDAAIGAHRLGCVTLVLPHLFELCPDGPGVDRLRSYPLVWLGGAPTRRPAWWVKRAVETTLAAAALLLLAPLIACCAVAVALESGFPVVFRQVRVGMDGRTFLLYKLRSVRPSAVDDSQTRWSVAGDSRVGPVGRFLRRSSLDELPQLWNVVRGDMCLVGPRPERPVFVEEFSAVHDLYWARHRVPTGLTGLAQVHGLRGDTSIADRARYDNYYIANWSLWLDAKIIILTVGELLCRRQR
ncbi:exopolysaccharide biosynthesis polyprenyl glycosylphosphotransferase [Amycolatopsis australiensis]|uniref:Exopolysaccharide biosynthesis polyprenyl glycosylphosphotransferase n=1 Tax=Amycolatopsis australiensis TaxID=546364 RepID=A0A1K1S188_9PSEU|nr:exopolysaccharide biosynthesis polyprenyl glycosylphosphotransferase [Amycolatopsis australiensis]SFW78123.1 exopolysaccharide biosynthesis polyprenyl glycosylphosphotransferase [Amycolatopsis australiensis]